MINQKLQTCLFERILEISLNFHTVSSTSTDSKPFDPPCWCWSQSRYCAVAYTGYCLGLVSEVINNNIGHGLLYYEIIMKC